MVQQANDWIDPKCTHALHARVRPFEVDPVYGVRRRAFPQNRISQPLQAQTCEQIEIFDSMVMSVGNQLIVECIVNPVHRTFHATPYL